MIKVAGYALLVMALLMFGMLAPTVGHMSFSEGSPVYMISMSILLGVSFIAARAGYEYRGDIHGKRHT